MNTLPVKNQFNFFLCAPHLTFQGFTLFPADSPELSNPTKFEFKFNIFETYWSLRDASLTTPEKMTEIKSKNLLMTSVIKSNEF